jgi:aminopeptidase-like protein
MALEESKTDMKLGESIHGLMTELYPIFRSITGEGVRQTLRIVKQHIPLEIHEVPTGTKVFDWEVPKEWNIRDAYICNPKGEKIVDIKNSNLHLLNYSIPVNREITLDELKQHLFYLPDKPDWIPYRTSYYKETWGFCITYNQYKSLEDGVYKVVIDSSLELGHLTYGELFLPGATEDEILFSTHVCHPSLCNDNLSGIGVMTFLAKELMKKKQRYSYRFLFIPATIGSITWLALNRDRVNKIKHGLVATLLGDPGPFHYKKTRTEKAQIDRVVEYVLRTRGPENRVMDFFPYGYDERQYTSPGFDLPVGRLTRAVYAQFPEYHTSADNLEFVKPECLEESFDVYMQIIGILEADKKYQNLNPYCEPQLGKRGLYDLTGGDVTGKDFQLALLWLLALSDGNYSLLDIAERAKIDFNIVKHAAEKLESAKLMQALD